MSSNGEKRIDEVFARLRNRREKGLITYIMAGDPELGTTERLVPLLAEAGADIIEIGVPFSDPLADGPVIQAASERALRNGVTIGKVLASMQTIRAHMQVPVILMTYYNPIYQYGIERFLDDANEVEVDGLLVPDLPLEESEFLRQQASNRGLAFIPFLAPTSSPARIAATAVVAQGFIYCISVTGVTGPRDHLPISTAGFLGTIRRYTNKPLAVGFGVSGPEQARMVSAYADAVVVGSAITNILSRGNPSKLPLAQVTTFVRMLKEALMA